MNSISGTKSGRLASGRSEKLLQSRYAVLGILSMDLETCHAMKKHVETNDTTRHVAEVVEGGSSE
jgi:hypothetical protein